MKYIIILCGILGVFCWIFAYMLITYRGIKDKTYGMPLVPLALNFGWEFIHTFCFTFSLYSQVTTGLWFLTDLGIVYTYFKYGYASFNKFHYIEKKQWYTISVFTFLVGFLINFFGYKFFSEYLNEFSNTESSAFIAWFILMATPICMLAMFFQRGNSKGQSFMIIGFMLLGNFFFIIQFVTHPSYYKWNNPFLILIIAISIIVELYYAKLLYKQLQKEGRKIFSL